MSILYYSTENRTVFEFLFNDISTPVCHFISSPGPKVIKLFSCSTQLSMKFSLLINMKMPTIFGIFIFISREIFMFSYG